MKIIKIATAILTTLTIGLSLFPIASAQTSQDQNQATDWGAHPRYSRTLAPPSAAGPLRA